MLECTVTVALPACASFQRSLNTVWLEIARCMRALNLASSERRTVDCGLDGCEDVFGRKWQRKKMGGLGGLLKLGTINVGMLGGRK